VADIGYRDGQDPNVELSVSRNELIKKGLVYAPERALLAFTVPRMHEFAQQEPWRTPTTVARQSRDGPGVVQGGVSRWPQSAAVSRSQPQSVAVNGLA
jgi:hypothetical protein